MRRFLAIVPAMVLLAALAGCRGKRAAPPGPVVAAEAAAAGGAGELGAGLNAFRRAGGRGALAPHPALARAAQRHAEYLAATGRVSHEGRGGSGVMDRVGAEGLRACFVAENIAEGWDEARGVLGGWQRSSGHRRNMLSPEASHYGTGRAGRVWVLVLARPC